MDCPARQKKWPLVMVRLYYKKKLTGVPSFDSSIRLPVFILLFFLQDSNNFKKDQKQVLLIFLLQLMGLVLEHTIYLSLPDVQQIQGLL